MATPVSLSPTGPPCRERPCIHVQTSFSWCWCVLASGVAGAAFWWLQHPLDARARRGRSLDRARHPRARDRAAVARRGRAGSARAHLPVVSLVGRRQAHPRRQLPDQPRRDAAHAAREDGGRRRGAGVGARHRRLDHQADARRAGRRAGPEADHGRRRTDDELDGRDRRARRPRPRRPLASPTPTSTARGCRTCSCSSAPTRRSNANCRPPGRSAYVTPLKDADEALARRR